MSNTNSPIELLVALGINTKASAKTIQSALDIIKNDLDLTINIKTSTSTNNSFDGLNNEIDNLKRQIDSLNKQLSNVGKNSKPINVGLNDAFTKEVKDVKALTRELDQYINRAFGEYDLTFDSNKKLKTLTANVKNELGEINKITYKPKFDDSGLLTGLEETGRKLKDVATKDLDINVDKALDKLHTFRNEGKVTADQFKHYQQLINSSMDNLTLEQTMKSLNREISDDVGMQKMLTTVNQLEKELVKLKDTGELTGREFEDFRRQIDGLDAGDLKSAEAILVRMKDRAEELNDKISLNDGLRKQNNSLAKLESDLVRIKNLYGKTFTDNEINAYNDISSKINSAIAKLNSSDGLSKRGLKEAQIEVEVLSQKVRRLGADATQAARSSIGLVEAFKIAMARFPVWMAASTVFYGVTRSIQSMTEKVLELDTAMVNLMRVSDAEQFEFDKVIERSIENVTTLSGKLTEYTELVNEFARTGKSIDESFDLANTTQMLMNISDLNAEEAFNSLTSASIAFNIAAEDSARIADKINQIDNDFAITTKDLSQALNKTASTAKTFGVELDTMLGHVTAIGSVTRESGNIVGNSLKTLYARIATNKNAINALSAIGISMEKVDGTAKSSAELIDELAKKWNTLSAAQQRSTSVGVAGIYQLSRLKYEPSLSEILG